MTIFMYNDLYLPTFPYLEIHLYNELKSRGMDVKYVLEEGDIRLVTSELSKIYLPITTTVKKARHINGLVGPKDLLVMRFCYKDVGGPVADAARASKKKILMLDPAAVDLCFRECAAQFITSKSSWMTERVKAKYPGRYKEIFTTGTIHFDEAFRGQSLDKKQLMEKHGLNPNKKLAILCKASQGEIGHQKGVDEEYKNIVEIIKNRCPDYELLFKAHPIDHHSQFPNIPGTKHKNEHYNNRPSWEALFPAGISVLEPALGYNGFKVADVILNVRSSVGMESVLFPTPLVNINSDKYLVNWPKSSNHGVMKNINICDLEMVLNSASFFVDSMACKRHAMIFCDPLCDGRAYARTADTIEKIL